MRATRGHQRHNLPTRRTRLIGREQDAAALRQAVLETQGHLVTLTGAGGCGKTRLEATHLASLAKATDGPLTQREREVARLIAHGLTNRQIAEQLVISPRTADRHVSNILDKLGLATRGQVAAWEVERTALAATSD